jgi:hypothetical protein
VRGQQVRAALGVQAVGVRPAFVHAAPRVCPVIVDLAAKQVPADAPHVLVHAEALQALVTGKDIIDVVDLERQMIQPRLLVLDAEKHVVVDVCLPPVAPVERTRSQGGISDFECYWSQTRSGCCPEKQLLTDE